MSVNAQGAHHAPAPARRPLEFLLAAGRTERIIDDMLVIMTILYMMGGGLFLASLTAHIYVRTRLRPGPDSDVDDYYHEFEDQHPGYARYARWLKITTGGAALGILLLFLGLVF